MAGGGGNTQTNPQQLQQWLQQFPQTSSGTAAANPMASATGPLQARLQQLQGAAGASPLQTMLGGLNVANQAQARPQAPMMQRPQVQLSGPPLTQAAGMNPQLAQLLQQRGLMG